MLVWVGGQLLKRYSFMEPIDYPKFTYPQLSRRGYRDMAKLNDVVLRNPLTLNHFAKYGQKKILH